MKNKKIIIFILIILFFAFIFSVFFSLLTMTNENIISGVSINHFKVSKLSKDDLSSKLSNLISDKKSSEIKLEYTSEKNKKYEKILDLSILNIQYDFQNCINNAYNLGRSGNIFQNNFTILKTLLFNKNFDLNISLDEKMLDTIISDISANLPGKIIKNSYYIENGTLVITRGKSGITVDNDAFKNELFKILQNLSFEDSSIAIPVKYVEADDVDLDKIHSEIYKKAKNAYFEKDPFKVYAEVQGVDFNVKKAQKLIEKNPNNNEYKIKLEYEEPKIKLKDLNPNIFNDKLGTFSTRYDETNTDRTTNLNLAAKKIDGTILAPGDEFSYNQIVGERSIAAGYKEAKIYQSGQIVDGLGGGICQISSTLYNAVVFANLKVTKRFNHQFVTSYVTAGRDATVAYGVKDFKFINNRTYPIKINISVNSGIAKVDIYGIKEENEYQIDIDVEVVSNIPYETKEQIDKSLPAGTEQIKQRGANGIIVNAYKITKKNGIIVSRELLSKDTYNALDRVIIKSEE